MQTSAVVARVAYDGDRTGVRGEDVSLFPARMSEVAEQPSDCSD
jgi:hypothetical protein